MPIKTEAIIVAGGQGRRMGRSVPKAFLSLAGQPILIYAIKNLSEMEEISGIILVVPPGNEKRAQKFCESADCLKKIKGIIPGGARRQDSVRNGIDYLAKDTEQILIHDAARPFSSSTLIKRVLKMTEKFGAAIPGVPLADTLKRVNKEGRVIATVDRRSLVAIQTPQGFKRELLQQAYRNSWKKNLAATDDAGLVEYLGHPIVVVEGDSGNFKITKPQDLSLAEMYLTIK